jgi:hypothetical protein
MNFISTQNIICQAIILIKIIYLIICKYLLIIFIIKIVYNFYNKYYKNLYKNN